MKGGFVEMGKFKVEKASPEPLERSRVLIKEVFKGGEEKTVAAFSALKTSRKVVVEEYGKFPLKARIEAFDKL